MSRTAWVGFLVLFALMGVPRFLALLPNLPDYVINENDVVEPAVAMLGGDLNHRQHKYGPVLMYLLAATYASLATIQGLTLDDYARRVFFEPTETYLVARIVSAALVTLMIATILIQGRKLFGDRAAVLGASLLSLPLIENLTGFQVKVDVAQALFQTLAIFAIIRIGEQDRLRDYIAAGAWSGLAFSSKPLQGLLILPMIILPRLFRVWSDARQSRRTSAEASKKYRKGSKVSRKSSPHPRRATTPTGGLISYLRAIFFSEKLIYGMIATCAVGLATYPYLLTEFQVFLNQNFLGAKFQAGTPSIRGYRVDLFLTMNLGWPISLLFFVSTIAAVRYGDRKLRLLIAFPVLYCVAFAFFPAKKYFYPAIIPALCMASGVILDRMLMRLSPSRWVSASCIVLGFIVLGASPSLRAWTRVDRALFSDDYWQTSATLSARRWIEENIPSGTGIYYYGWYPYGPRIISHSVKRQARMGEYFMYRRNENEFLRNRFEEAYSQVVRSGRPTYNVHYTRTHPRLQAATGRRATLLNRMLPSYCRERGLRYIVLAGKLRDDLPWFDEVERVAHFIDGEFREVSIFEVAGIR